MKSSRSVLAVAFSLLLIVACENQQNSSGTPTASLATKSDSVSYSLGYLYGQSLNNQGYEEINEQEYLAGFYTALKGDKGSFADADMIRVITERREELRLAVLEKVKAEGEAFLELNKANDGVMVTESGLQYKIINAGPESGKSPKATDVVSVHYEGQLLDGTYFDTSREELAIANDIHNPQRTYGPTEFPLNRVISGWTEGVQLMREGAVFEFYIPSDLAYGDQQAGNLIKPGSTLIFKVELLEVK